MRIIAGHASDMAEQCQRLRRQRAQTPWGKLDELTCRFEELAEAFKPVAGEVDTIHVPVSVMRRLMNFCEDKLARLQKVAEYAEYLPDEALAEILAAGDRRGEGSDIGACRHASDVKDEEQFQP